MSSFKLMKIRKIENWKKKKCSFSRPTNKMELCFHVALHWLQPPGYSSLYWQPSGQQARGAVWGPFPDAQPASGNDWDGQYSTNKQTKQNNTLCTNPSKIRDREAQNQNVICYKQEAVAMWEQQNCTWHPDHRPPGSCCLDSQDVRRKIKTPQHGLFVKSYREKFQ